MVQRNFEGWVEFDVKPALKLWEKGNRNLGLAIDVQDQDMNPLSAATFFDPYNCQACQGVNCLLFFNILIFFKLRIF